MVGYKFWQSCHIFFCEVYYFINSIYNLDLGDFQKNEDFSFSENNLNIKWYERKVNILKQAQ